MRESEKLLKPMTLGDVLDYSIEVYKRNIKSIALILLVTFIPMVVLSAIINGLYQSIMLPYTLKRYYYLANGYRFNYLFLEKPSIPLALTILSLLFSFFAFIHFLLLRPVINAAITRIVYNDVVAQKKQSVKQILRESFSRYGSLIGNWILYLLIMVGIIIGLSLGAFIVYVIIVLIDAVFSPLGLAGLIIGVILVCLIAIAAIAAFIVFYYYFRVRFYSTFSIIIEKKKAAEAFSRSLELTGKNFWHISLVSAFVGLFLNLLTLLFSYGTYAGILVNNTFFMFVYILGQLMAAFVATFLTTVLTMIYINMKVKKEGLDLEVRVDRLLDRQNRSETGEPLNE